MYKKGIYQDNMGEVVSFVEFEGNRVLLFNGERGYHRMETALFDHFFKLVELHPDERINEGHDFPSESDNLIEVDFLNRRRA